MNIPCDQHVDCECSNLPLTNYSAEDPDRFVFLARKFPKPGVPPMRPPTTHDPTTCVTFASSPVSQTDADACAERHVTECVVGSTIEDPCEVCATQPISTSNNTSFGGYQATTPTGDCCDPDAPDGCCCVDVPGNPNDPPDDPDNPNPPVFGNAAQTCTSMCPDGTVSSFTVRAGFFVSTSQELADRSAHTFACTEARRLRVCIAPFDGISCADPESANPPEVHQLIATSTLPITAWGIASGSLPTGITLDPATGLMSGQPTEAGTFNFVIQATSSAGVVATRAMVWNILGFVTAASLPDATVGAAYSEQLLADGGAITFEITDGSLPAGLTMDDAGLISGTPTTAVTDQEFTVSVSDNFGHTCDQQFLITVGGQCQDWSALTWGVPVTTPTGAVILTFTPTSAAGVEFHATLDAPDTSTDAGIITCTGTIMADGNACNCNLHYELTRVNTGGVTNQGSISINIPPGISVFQPFTGLDPDGSFNFPFALPDNGGVPYLITVTVLIQQNIFLPGENATMDLLGSISCCTITNPSPLPDGKFLTPYSEQLTVFSLTGPYTFTVTDGALPAGLNLTAAGLINGTPTTPGLGVAFTVEVENALGQVCEKDFTIDILPGSCPDWTTLSWGVPTIVQVGGGITTFVPNSAAADNFQAQAEATNGATDSGYCQNTGTLTFNGGPCAANLHMIVIKFAGAPANLSGTVSIPSCGVFLDYNVLPGGISDIPFTVPDTLGLPLNIQVIVTCQVPVGGTPPGGHTIILIGTFSNI